jgi:hypothetical protein
VVVIVDVIGVGDGDLVGDVRRVRKVVDVIVAGIPSDQAAID